MRARLILVVFCVILLAAAVAGAAYYRSGTPPAAVSQDILEPAAATSTIERETADYRIHAEYPQFGIPAVDEAIRRAVMDGADALAAQASADQPALHQFPTYSFDAAYDSAYVGPDIISVRITTYTFTGGAHGMPAIFGMNFERRAGREFTLDDALSLTGLTLGELAAEARARLTAQFGADIIAPEGFDPKPENYQAFYITKDSVVLIFQPYQVTPYAAGAPEVSFPRTK